MKIDKKEKSVAILTIYNISEMTTKGRKDILNWLKAQVKNIEKYHKNPGFAGRYTARYISLDATGLRTTETKVSS